MPKTPPLLLTGDVQNTDKSQALKISQVNPKNPHVHGNYKLNPETTEDQLKAGYKMSDIAKLQGVHESQVSVFAKKYGLRNQHFEQFKKNKIESFERDQHDNSLIQGYVKETWTRDNIKAMEENTKGAIFRACTVDTGVKQDKIKEMQSLAPVAPEKLTFTVVYHDNRQVNINADKPKIDTAKTEAVDKL